MAAAAVCSRPGCDRETWNGRPEELWCSTVCKHALPPANGKLCSCGRPAAQGYETCCRTCGGTGGKQHGPTCEREFRQPRRKCVSCDLAAAEPHPTCCRTCSNTSGAEHGRNCEHNPNRCLLEGCDKRTWNGKPNEFCSMACKRTFESLRAPQPQPEIVQVPRPQAYQRTFESSNYMSTYGRAEACSSIPAFWETVPAFLESFFVLKGKSAEEAQHHAQRFTTELRRDVENTRFSSEAELKIKLQTEAPWVCVRCWTSAATLDDGGDWVQGKEWCALLQEGVRLDHASLFPALSMIWATMNQFCVQNRITLHTAEVARLVPWPVSNNPQTGEEPNVLFRGGRLPTEHVEWFQHATERGTVYRVPMAVATSTEGMQSLDFMVRYGYPKEAPMVQWRYHLHPTLRCKHINCLEKLTMVRREQEFLLPPYSSFRAIKFEYLHDADIGGGQTESYYCIDVEIMPDNKAMRDGGTIPDNVELAPWA